MLEMGTRYILSYKQTQKYYFGSNKSVNEFSTEIDDSRQLTSLDLWRLVVIGLNHKQPLETNPCNALLSPKLVHRVPKEVLTVKIGNDGVIRLLYNSD